MANEIAKPTQEEIDRGHRIAESVIIAALLATHPRPPLLASTIAVSSKQIRDEAFDPSDAVDFARDEFDNAITNYQQILDAAVRGMSEITARLATGVVEPT